MDLGGDHQLRAENGRAVRAQVLWLHFCHVLGINRVWFLLGFYLFNITVTSRRWEMSQKSLWRGKYLLLVLLVMDRWPDLNFFSVMKFTYVFLRNSLLAVWISLSRCYCWQYQAGAGSTLSIHQRTEDFLSVVYRNFSTGHNAPSL